MTTYFVTRHAGAKQWASEQGINVDSVVDHLNIDGLQTGDTVLGSLPVNLVAELNEKGVRYFHLTLPLARPKTLYSLLSRYEWRVFSC